MVAKRTLDFSTPSSRKRARTASTMVVYRGPRIEMKYFDTEITHGNAGATLSSALPICSVGNNTIRGGRIGNRIKIHRVQAMIVLDGASQPIKVELNLPKDTSVAPQATFTGFTNQDSNSTVYSRILHTGTEANPGGFMLNHKLPYGLVCTFNGSAGTNINRGNLHLCLATNSLSVIDGFVRVWFTDA